MCHTLRWVVKVNCCGPRQPWDERILLHELYQLSLVVREQKRTQELRDAKLFNDLQQVNFVVKIALGLVEDFFLAGLFALSFAAAAVEPATTAVDLIHKPVWVCLGVKVAKYTARCDWLFYLFLVFVHVLIEFIVHCSGIRIFSFIFKVFPGVELLD